MHPMEAVLTEARIPFKRGGEHHHVRKDFIGVDCYTCGVGSGAYHLGISPTLGCRCWRCGKKTIWDVWRNLRLPGSWKDVAGHYRREEYHRPTGTYTLPTGTGSLRSIHKRWLRGRGLVSSEMEKLWHLQGTNHRAGRLAWRVVAPVLHHGKEVSWTSRRTGESGKRWVSAKPEHESWPLGELVYGMQHVTSWAVIVEGPTDVWKVGPGAVACLGLGGMTNAQLLTLASIPNRWVLFDDEPRAQAEASKLCAKLAEFPGSTTRLELEDGFSGRDPGDCSYDEVLELRQMVGCTREITWILT